MASHRLPEPAGHSTINHWLYHCELLHRGAPFSIQISEQLQEPFQNSCPFGASGATGFVGNRLVKKLREGGKKSDIHILSRRPIPDCRAIICDLQNDEIPQDALENIDMLVNEEIDIIFIIVDYQMPKMTGAELIRLIKEKHAKMSCVMLSGQANTTSVNSLKEEKLLDEFIAKPWNEEELFDLLRPLIDSRK